MSHKTMKYFSLILLTVTMSFWVLPTVAKARMSNGALFGWSRTDWDYEVPSSQTGDSFDAKNGFQVGLFLAKPLSPNLSLRGEVLYVRKGAKVGLVAISKSGDSLGSFDLFYNADYFQVPLILNYALVAEGGVKPVLLAGPYMAFNYSIQTKGELPPLAPCKSSPSVLGDFPNTDFGFVLGGGLEFPKGERTFLLQLRYDLGLTDSYLTAKNKAWTLMTGVGF